MRPFDAILLRVNALVLVLLVITGLPGKTALAAATRHETTWQGVTRSYVVQSPSNADASSPLPLLVLLHGSGRRGKVMIDEWQELAGQQGIILVAPDSLNAKSWRGPSDGPGFLKKVVDEVSEAYPVDASRIYLFGHSSGAHFALVIGLMESEYFAAVAVHAGAIATSSESFVNVATRKIPFALWSGQRDRTVPIADVERTVALLSRNGFPASLSVMPHHDHNYYAVSSRVNLMAWRFLSAHVLPHPPRYADHGDRDEALPR